MDGVVSPLDQRYVVPKLEVRSTESPGQKSTAPEVVMVGAPGGVLIVTSVTADNGLRQVVASVICTVKLPAVFTRMVWVVSPVDHSHVSPALADRSMESPGQIATGPAGVMVGAAGGVLTVTNSAAEESLRQLVASVICTV